MQGHQRAGVGLEWQARPAREVPSVHDQFPECNDANHLAGLVGASDAGDPGPRLRVAAGLGECPDPAGQRPMPFRARQNRLIRAG